MIVVEENPEDARIELSKEEIRRFVYELNAEEGTPPGGARVGQELRMQLAELLGHMNGNYTEKDINTQEDNK
jgi:hypothetical protein